MPSTSSRGGGEEGEESRGRRGGGGRAKRELGLGGNPHESCMRTGVNTSLPSPALPCPPPLRFTAYIYPVIVAILLWGPQDRDHNFVLSLFWAWWWPLSFVAFILLGRVWCAVRAPHAHTLV